MDEQVMYEGAGSGNLKLVQWLKAEGCKWDHMTCYCAIDKGHLEVLRWARENGCEWEVFDRDEAARKFGYTDDLGNPVDEEEEEEVLPISSDGEPEVGHDYGLHHNHGWSAGLLFDFFNDL